MLTAIDECHEQLHRLAWSAGETYFGDGPERVWQVDVERGLLRIVTRAPTRTYVWRLAIAQARRRRDAEAGAREKK
jgi:hypothetical protein